MPVTHEMLEAGHGQLFNFYGLLQEYLLCDGCIAVATQLGEETRNSQWDQNQQHDTPHDTEIHSLLQTWLFAPPTDTFL